VRERNNCFDFSLALNCLLKTTLNSTNIWSSFIVQKQ
jgi:hypothetical protein